MLYYKQFLNMKKNIEAAKRRIAIVKRLTEVKDQFRDLHAGLVYRTDQQRADAIQLYKDYSGLRYYLLLTCFDILGQSKPFHTFNEWLEATSVKEERDTVIAAVGDGDLIDKVKYVHKKYLELYGVTQAFKYFIHEVLSEENREKLYDSLRIRKVIVSIAENKGKHMRQDINKLPAEIVNRLGGFQLDWIPTENQKDNFLFDIRNSFTHSGVSMAEGLYGVWIHSKMDFEIPQRVIGTQKREFRWIFIHNEEYNSFRKEYHVKGWPSVLIEILEDTIKEMDQQLIR